jgi:hypothetical protein
MVETSVLIAKDSHIIDVIEEPWNSELSVIHMSPKDSSETIRFDFYVIPIGTEMTDTSLIGRYYSTINLNGQTVSIFQKLKKQENGED